MLTLNNFLLIDEPVKMDNDMDNTSDKSPSLDRSLIEELNNLDGVALNNLEDWNRLQGGESSLSLDTVDSQVRTIEPDQEVGQSKEWSPSSSDLAAAGPASPRMPRLPGLASDSEVETLGSGSEPGDVMTDYENSDMVEYQAAVAAGREDEERQCWVCFASQEDDPVAAWVAPCLCKGTTKWVHQARYSHIYDLENSYPIRYIHSHPAAVVDLSLSNKVHVCIGVPGLYPAVG